VQHRNANTQPLARWRAACVDGLLHAAYAAAVAAESTAHRCAETLADSRKAPRRRGRQAIAMPLGRKRPRRPSNGRSAGRRHAR
jgi:hypothetical protein